VCTRGSGFQKLCFRERLDRFDLRTDFALETELSDGLGENERFGEMFIESGICGLDGVIFSKIGGDVNVRRVRIEHCRDVMMVVRLQ
jgi:hypothetical protein